MNRQALNKIGKAVAALESAGWGTAQCAPGTEEARRLAYTCLRVVALGLNGLDLVEPYKARLHKSEMLPHGEAMGRLSADYHELRIALLSRARKAGEK